MMDPYWHDLVTRRSWEALTRLARDHRFVLIGGWAIYLYARTLKSKDVDIIVSYDELGRLQRDFPLTRNDRLKKYEAKDAEVDIDVYTPHYSNPGIPAEAVLLATQALEGFTVPVPEVLLLLKQHAYSRRAGSAKGEKDRLDVVSLLRAREMDWGRYRETAARHRPASPSELAELIKGLREVPELGLRAHETSRLKRAWLEQLAAA